VLETVGLLDVALPNRVENSDLAGCSVVAAEACTIGGVAVPA
jgi:hypothetical protein